MSPTDVFSPGSTALITGAGSGIGLAIAKTCRSKGMCTLLVDNNEEALEALTKTHFPNDSDVVTSKVDVSSTSDWQALKKLALDKFGSIELLVLNAGRGLRGTWGDDDYFRDTLETNLFGVIHGINTFLSVVQDAAKSKPTSIVITGSKQGITNPPGNPAYNASKAAVKTLAEHLSWDLKDTSTSVHLLVPGWTYTGLTRATPDGVKPAGAWTAEQVADYLYEKMGKNEFYIICPDNDVTEEQDKKRMTWAAGDVVQRRPPLSRWRGEWKQEAEETMAKMDL
ncbi:3-beta-hydroxycholanate 3-dehydrogenase (NAD(+)) 2 [Fusarium oxysporum f. sp. rapae]|uniref:3-beta-hydroxycholanate 3-dehydrogenase (NAD(+)) 2 n=1 Tax=Fusarium oxysporum f. sp. rapae TaxID=485398 RepID=A0A8J5NIY6_FUSOX|nr:3-beta-hydroxycholanate 3-dehydrogenase (NAD(+)) 2 [Fusarium oxysporum f. sp. rapae]